MITVFLDIEVSNLQKLIDFVNDIPRSDIEGEFIVKQNNFTFVFDLSDTTNQLVLVSIKSNQNVCVDLNDNNNSGFRKSFEVLSKDDLDIDQNFSNLSNYTNVAKKVIRLDNNLVYPSLKCAARLNGLSFSGLRSAIESDKFIKGIKFEYVDDSVPVSSLQELQKYSDPKLFINVPKLGKQIRHIRSGTIYRSETQAAKAHKLAQGSITYAVKNCKPVKGEWFEFVDQPLPLSAAKRELIINGEV